MSDSYNEFTEHLVKTARSFRMPNATYAGKSYSLTDVVYKFRAAFQDETMRNAMLGDWFKYDYYSCGFCGIASYALHKIFPAFSIDATGSNSHVWNVLRGKIFDITHDQFPTTDKKKYYYTHGIRNVENMKLDPYLDKQSDLFLNLVLGRDVKK
jgi:hypothetical protein